MRIVNEVNKGLMKVTVFHYQDKYSLKFEKNSIDYIIKFKENEVTEEGINQKFLNETSLEKWQNILDNIEDFKIENLIAIEGEKGIVFPEII